MIYIRDDDVLMFYDKRKNLYPDPAARFVEVHEVIKTNPSFMHVPAIVCKDIQEWPKIIDYIANEWKEGRMEPQLHCWEHIDYRMIDMHNINNDLHKCFSWFKTHGIKPPTRWYTPWGYVSDNMVEVAETYGLTVIGLDRAIRLHGAFKNIRRGKRTLKSFDGCELFWHWWSGGDRIKELMKCRM